VPCGTDLGVRPEHGLSVAINHGDADGSHFNSNGEPTMQKLKKDLGLVELPAPVALTPDQLVAVAAGTSAVFRGSLGPIIIAGGIPSGPFTVPTGPFTVPQTAL
jgi:hypothetical protein